MTRQARNVGDHKHPCSKKMPGQGPAACETQGALNLYKGYRGYRGYKGYKGYRWYRGYRVWLDNMVYPGSPVHPNGS